VPDVVMWWLVPSLYEERKISQEISHEGTKTQRQGLILIPGEEGTQDCRTMIPGTFTL